MTDSKTPETTSADACPVDHKSREAWLAQARAQSDSQPPSHPSPPAREEPRSWTQAAYSYLPFTSSTPPPAPTGSPAQGTKAALDTDRVISSIPRSSDPGATSCPVNNEEETGKDASGNWVYPSEKMFFEAMRRKGMGAKERDMQTVVPIHNAVNERAWREIVEWEAPYQGECGGPKLHSFSGDASKMSPKARVNTLLGYTKPFDRHDWVVDRCGTRVEYIIDFYSGRAQAAGGAMAGVPSFYLDVRPKLNSWEGVKMRALRGLGLY